MRQSTKANFVKDVKDKRRICVFLGSGKNVPESQIEYARLFGSKLAQNGYDLVWGGCDVASMGSIARGVQEAGGKAIGVVPEYMKEKGIAYTDADELILVPDLLERKKQMIEISDAFVTLPGGLGTLDEFASVLAEQIIASRYGKIVKKSAVLSLNGFYDSLEMFLENLYKEGFAYESYRDLYRVVRNESDLFSYIATE